MEKNEPQKLSRREFLTLGATSLAAISVPASLIAVSETELVKEALAELNDETMEEELVLFSGDAGQCSGAEQHWQGDGFFDEWELA
ncbi:MAG: hypothetical protein P1V97_35125 [Planctomycetota bacterium]|nr:hypothetical protein [Planctomycetota bacterium]